MFNFRKVLSVLPWVSLNVGKNGANSVNIGVKGLNININKKGDIRGSISVPGIPGLRYTKKLN